MPGYRVFSAAFSVGALAIALVSVAALSAANKHNARMDSLAGVSCPATHLDIGDGRCALDSNSHRLGEKMYTLDSGITSFCKGDATLCDSENNFKPEAVRDDPSLCKHLAGVPYPALLTTSAPCSA